MTSSKKNISFINLANIVSAIAVVFLHANGCFWAFSSTERYWMTANIIECVFYFAVPVFFMISGATLLNFYERYTLKEYFSKRISKTLIPYIVWSIIALFFRVFITKSIDINSVNLKFIFDKLTTGSIIDYYWFFIPLFCIYLSIPLFAAVDKKNKKNLFSYLVLIGFVFNVLFPFIKTVYNINIFNLVTVNVISNYLFYVLVGYLITNYDINKRSRYIIYLFGIVGLLTHIVGTYELSISSGYIVKTFKGYNNLPCVLYSTAVFTFFKYAGSIIMTNKYVSYIVNILKKYTFSIYLTHWFVMRGLIKLFSFNTKSILYRLGIPFVVVIIIVIFTYIARKTKIGRYILP